MALGLSVADQLYFENLLRSPHWVSSIVRVLDLNGNYLADISDRLITGQVNIDITAEVSRSCTMDIMDPGASLGFDANDPTHGSMFLDKMLQVFYVVQPPDRSKIFTVPIFTGPLNKVQRSGPVIKAEAQGKEIMAKQALRSSITYSTRWQKRAIILSLLDSTGETKFNFEPSTAMNTKAIALTREHNPWTSAQTIARSMGMNLFYDGRGVAQLRRASSTPRFLFDGRIVTAAPEPGYELGSLINDVLVIGGGKTKPIRRTAPSSHSMSPTKLGRNGRPRYFTQVLEDSSLTTTAAQVRAGDAALAQGLLQSVDIAFASLPVPHLEEYDAYTYSSPTYAVNASLRSASIPLTADGTMSIGALRRVTPLRTVFRKV